MRSTAVPRALARVRPSEAPLSGSHTSSCRPGRGAANAQAELSCAAKAHALDRGRRRVGEALPVAVAGATDRPAQRRLTVPPVGTNLATTTASYRGRARRLGILRSLPSSAPSPAPPVCGSDRGSSRQDANRAAAPRVRGPAGQGNRAPRVRRPCARGAKNCRRPRPSLFHRGPTPSPWNMSKGRWRPLGAGADAPTWEVAPVRSRRGRSACGQATARSAAT